MEGYVVGHGEGKRVDLGVITMRLIVSNEVTNGAFAMAEFRGAEGRWTIPHVHRRLEESFFVLGGSFVFTLGDRERAAGAGDFVLVPRGTPHVLGAGAAGGSLLAVWSPGGLEEMFLELGQLPPESITDPGVRARIAQRYDSVPV